MKTEKERDAQAIFDGAQLVENGVRELHRQWREPSEPSFEELTASLFGANQEVDPSTLERLDATAKEIDLSVIEAQGDEYPLSVLKLAYAYSAIAADAATAGELFIGWTNLNHAYYWYGQLEGREWGSWEQETHQQKHDTPKLIAKERREQGRRGARARLENDPKQAAKAMVKECWIDWQMEPARYASKSAFALDMLSKFEQLQSQAVIAGWCRTWEENPAG